MATSYQQQPYGHSFLPPPSNAYYPPTEPDHLSGCDRFCVYPVIIFIIIIIGLYILFVIGGLIFLSPYATMPQLNVANASLAEFDLSTTSNNTLSYNLFVNMNLQNPNEDVKLSFNRTQVRAYYKGVKFAEKEFPTIYFLDNVDEHTSSELVGQTFISLDHEDLSQYDSEKKSGIFRIDLKVNTHMRLSLAGWMQRFVPQIFYCQLKVPLVLNSNSSFVTTKCYLGM